MKALVVAGGDVAPLEERADRPRWSADGELLVIAADGGLLNAQALQIPVDVVVGDGDSLSPATIDTLPGQGIEFQRYPVDKDASDTELALREALARGAGEVVVLGALGGLRFDHTLANVLLLAGRELGSTPVALVDGTTTVRVLDGERGNRRGAELDVLGAAGDIVSLLPLSEQVRGVTLAGLRYPLERATLRRGSSLGLSNVLTGERATIHIDAGCLVVVHVRQQVPA
jgi:thiamine pyrophosphokinase